MVKIQIIDKCLICDKEYIDPNVIINIIATIKGQQTYI